MTPRADKRHWPITLGVDCSMREPGFAVIDSHGHMIDYDRPNMKSYSRLYQVAGLFVVTRRLLKVHDAKLVAIESSAHERIGRRGAGASDLLSFSRGVVWAACVDLGLTPVEYSWRAVRASVVGLSRCGKQRVIAILQARGHTLPVDKKGIVLHDVADALALALHAQAIAALGNMVKEQERGERSSVRGTTVRSARGGKVSGLVTGRTKR